MFMLVTVCPYKIEMNTSFLTQSFMDLDFFFMILTFNIRFVGNEI